MISWILLILTAVVYADKSPFVQLDALDDKYVIALEDEYTKEIKCIKNMDEHLKAIWTEELNKISIQDVGEIPDNFRFEASSVPKYDTKEQEWLMEAGSPARQIDTCMRNLVVKVAPRMRQDEIDCLNNAFSSHLRDEMVYKNIYEEFVRDASREQLPFRRIFSFTEFIEMLYQNRNPDALTDVERTLYEHAASYLTKDSDKLEHIWTTEQECEWQNARALRETANEDAKFKEFETQVRHSVNRQLASELVKRWILNETISKEKHEKWVQARRDMETRIKDEIKQLRTQKKDVQWLCEYATQLAHQISDVQKKILISDGVYYQFSLEVVDVAKKAWNIVGVLTKRKDFRKPIFQTLSEGYDVGARCLSAFAHLVQNHKRYEIALAFVDGLYTYPEIFCKRQSLTLGLINTRLCNCIGSFCVSHGLAAVFVEEYKLVQQPDGTYRVVVSGVKSRKKVKLWTND